MIKNFESIVVVSTFLVCILDSIEFLRYVKEYRYTDIFLFQYSLCYISNSMYLINSRMSVAESEQIRRKHWFLLYGTAGTYEKVMKYLENDHHWEFYLWHAQSAKLLLLFC